MIRSRRGCACRDVLTRPAKGLAKRGEMGRIVSLGELESIRNEAHHYGLGVVFTNGCFDLIHRGHIEYLQKARVLGDVLVVGLNSDDSMRQIKGEGRPIVPQEDRAVILAALECVDYVVIFDEETPACLIETLKPDILVKGADYHIDEIVGREVVEENGGRVETIDMVPERSTTQIIQTILNRFGG
jgi:rfaE bifunctional protein nucleotidyltransferase chain/domain